MKTSMSSISIFVPPLAAWVSGQPLDRPAPAPRWCGGRLRGTGESVREMPETERRRKQAPQ